MFVLWPLLSFCSYLSVCCCLLSRPCLPCSHTHTSRSRLALYAPYILRQSPMSSLGLLRFRSVHTQVVIQSVSLPSSSLSLSLPLPLSSSSLLSLSFSSSSSSSSSSSYSSTTAFGPLSAHACIRYPSSSLYSSRGSPAYSTPPSSRPTTNATVARSRSSSPWCAVSSTRGSASSRCTRALR